MLTAVASWVEDAGVIFAALVATVTFFGIVGKSPLGRWVGRQVAEDVESWVQRISREAATHALAEHKADLDTEVEVRLDEMIPRHLEPVLYELRTNGGGSFRDDTVDRLDQINRRLDRFATFMDDSTMDRKDLRENLEAHIARTAAWLADREEPDDPQSD